MVMRSRSLLKSYSSNYPMGFLQTIAIKHYESYTKLKGHKTVVEPCSLVINSKNFILGATSDGKVVFDGEFGINKLNVVKNIAM